MEILAAIALLVASERVEIRDGRMEAPGVERCVLLRATGSFRNAIVVVNQITAGELKDADSELDITGSLSLGAANSIEVRGRGVEHVWAWIGPLVYIASARPLNDGRLEVTVANTTGNTAQVEIGEQQFTVSPGTRATRTMPWPHGVTRLRMRAVSDGLDREFVDEIPLPNTSTQ